MKSSCFRHEDFDIENDAASATKVLPDETDNRADRHTCYHLGILRYRGCTESQLLGFYKSQRSDGATDRDGSGCKSHHPIRRTMLIVDMSTYRHSSRSVESALLTPAMDFRRIFCSLFDK